MACTAAVWVLQTFIRPIAAQSECRRWPEGDVANDRFVELQFAEHGFGGTAAMEIADWPKRVGYGKFARFKSRRST